MKQPALPFHIYKPPSPRSPCLQNTAAAQQNTACGVSCCDPKYSRVLAWPWYFAAFGYEQWMLYGS